METTVDHLGEALRQVQRYLRTVQEPWLVGGSCGLLLHGVPLRTPPRDLDLYADTGAAERLHHALQAYAVDEQKEDRSGMYKSVLSHYEIAGVKVELVCGFEVTVSGNVYKVEAGYLAANHLQEIHADTQDNWTNADTLSLPALKLMPLEHELLFNLLRNRPDRYEAIAAVMRSRYKGMTQTMRDLIRRNSFSRPLITQAKQLLQAGSKIT